jgi:regulatory protein
MSRSPARLPAPLGLGDLPEAAAAYLARYASSAENLRRVLVRKIRRSAVIHGFDSAPLIAEAERIVAHYVAIGVLDDRVYAEMQIRTLRRRGSSARAIAGRLASKGIAGDTIGDAIGKGVAGDGSGAGDDRDAALRLARRRRLGPFRTGDRGENRLRDLAILGRAGFDYATAASVIDAPADETD